MCFEAKEHLFQEQHSPSSDLLYHILWSRCSSLVLCASQSCGLTLAFLGLPISVSAWFITCPIAFILAAYQNGAWAKNTVEQKVLHAFTVQIQLCRPSLWSQSSFLSPQSGREPIAFNGSFACKALCDCPTPNH